MALTNPNKVAPIDGELNPEEFLDYIIKYNDGETPQFGIAPELRKKLGGAVSRRNKQHDELLEGIRKLMLQYGYGKIQDFTKEYYDVYQPWKDAHKMGGHFNYQKIIDELNNEKRIEKELTKSNLWYQTQNAKDQFENYPRTKLYAKAAIIISLSLLILELAKWIVSLNSTSSKIP